MKNIVRISLGFLVLISLQGCFLSDQGLAIPTPTSDAQLDLILKLDKASYLSSEQITASLTLVNKSSDALFVKKRFGYASGDPDVIFTIQGPLGSQINPRLFISEVPLNEDDFGIIKPLDEYSRKFPLALAFDFSVPGAYTIQALYQNEMDFGDERLAWVGKLSSNIVEIQITP